MEKLILVLCVVVASISYSQFSQQGGKLLGTGSAGTTPGQGSAVALSSDGNTAIVGGWDDNGGIGAAWIFIRSGGHWTQQGSKIVGTGYNNIDATFQPNQGIAVALSADGNTAIVGGDFDNGRVGAAWIFTRSGGVWSQQGNKLVGNDYVISITPASFQGYSVGLSADGNTAIVGGYYDNNKVGAAWIYKRTSGVWSQVGSKLLGNGWSGQAQQGYSVALSGDGNTAVVGGNNDAPNYGSAFVYVWNGTTWVEQGNKLVGGYYSAFGSSVALSSDGNTLIVGGSGDYYYASIGAVWIFVRKPDSSWALKANELCPNDYTTGTPSIGGSVSLSSDGRTAIVGGRGDSLYVGAAWIFQRPIATDTGWVQTGTKLYGTDVVGIAQRGSSVAISGDGNTALIGGYGDSSFAGATWVYATPSAPLPVELTSFTATANHLNAELHWSTATEINNTEFEIERRPLPSPPLKEEGTEGWGRVGSVAGAGTSNSPKSYSFTDNVAAAGTYSYRLKQIDHNGAFVYSQTVQVIIAVPKVLALSQNYPEPFNPSTTIQFTVPDDGKATLKIFNSLGQEIATLFDGEAAAGVNHELQFNGSNLASGIYFSRLEFGGKMQVMKMMLLK